MPSNALPSSAPLVNRPMVSGFVVVLLFALGCVADDAPAADAAAVVDAPSNPDAAPADALVSWDAGPAAFDASADAIAATPCGLPQPSAVVDVSVGDLYDRIDAEEPLAVVDVREPSETALGIIEGALTYPWNSGVLTSEHSTLPDDVPLFVICRSGSRSALASQFLFDNDHVCVHNVLGGMNAWTGAGYPTVVP